jgi:hypothetical protein
MHFVSQSVNECSIKLFHTKIFATTTKGHIINRANFDKFILSFLGRNQGACSEESYFLEPHQSPTRDDLSNLRNLSFLRWLYKLTP